MLNNLTVYTDSSKTWKKCLNLDLHHAKHILQSQGKIEVWPVIQTKNNSIQIHGMSFNVHNNNNLGTSVFKSIDSFPLRISKYYCNDLLSLPEMGWSRDHGNLLIINSVPRNTMHTCWTVIIEQKKSFRRSRRHCFSYPP